MAKAYCLKTDDNVATALEDITAGERVDLIGTGSRGGLEIRESIRSGHKVALVSIGKGGDIVKFGVAIGIASADIEKGSWVHIHNCSSRYDERSGSFDPVSGATKDTGYRIEDM